MPDLQTMVKIFAVLLITLLIVIGLFRIFSAVVFRIIVILAILFILTPTLCTIMWGDGEAYVAKVAKLFSPEIEQQINDGYAFYHNADDPVVNLDQLNEYFDMAKNHLTGANKQDELVFPTR